jgi:hypothetical protein
MSIARLFLIGAFAIPTFVISSCKSVRNQPSASDLSDSMRGQDQADAHIFRRGIPEITIHLHGTTWKKIVSHKNDGGYACEDGAPYGHIKELRYVNKETGANVALNNVGMRVKGNTSCDDPVKNKGFKISFKPVDKLFKDESGKVVWRLPRVYEEWGKPLDYPQNLQSSIKEQNLFGLTSLSLRRGSADPTLLRDTISSNVFSYGGELARRQGDPGAPKIGGAVFRSTIAWVKIHDGLSTILEGHYGLVELPDEDFIKTRYGKNAARHLYKIKEAKGTFLPSDMPADHRKLLTYYEPEIIDGDGYDSNDEYNAKQTLCSRGQLKQSSCDKAKKQRDDAAKTILGFRQLLEEITKISDSSERKIKLQQFLDIDNILSYMAAVNLTGHWDSLIGETSNNDYLFFNDTTKKWGIMTWDLDNSFGAGQKDSPWMAGIQDFGVDMKYRPLFKAVMDNFAHEYRSRMKDFLKGVYDFDAINSTIVKARDRIAPANQEERYELLFRFKNHRWANAWCQSNEGLHAAAVVENGWPVIIGEGQGRRAKCMRR